MIRTAIADVLRPLAFKKRRNSFFRDTGHGWILIDFQASQFGSRDKVSFTINLGVSFFELQPPDEAPPSLGRAHVRERIGRVISTSGDIWWSLDPASDLTTVAVEVTELLSREAIPWLEQRVDLADVLAATQLDASFVEPWQLARLRVLAERAEQHALADQLDQLSRRQATT